MTTFGADLRQRRHAAGLSLRQLAREVHYTVGYLSKIENGTKQPGEQLARLCDAAVGAGGQLAGLAAPRRLGRAAPGGAPGGPPLGGTPFGDPFGAYPVALDAGPALAGPLAGQPALAGGQAPGGQLAGGQAPGGQAPGGQVPGGPVAGGQLPGGQAPGGPVAGGFAVGELTPGVRAAADLAATEDGYRAMFDQVRALGHQVSPQVVLGVLREQTGAVHRLAVGAGDPRRIRRLMLLAARYAEYTGWMSQEAGDESAAWHWTQVAARLAGTVGDADLVRFALLRAADLAFYRDDASRTIELAERAQADPTTAPRVRGLAAQREAQGHALAGDHAACMRALDRSAELLATAAAEGGDGAATLGSTSLASASAMIRGWVLYDLGRPGQAAGILDAEVPAIPAAAARSRARFGVRRALAHAGAGDLDRACALTTELLPTVHQADSATIRLDLSRLARTLRRWPADPRVRALDPALATALRAGAG